MPKMTTANDHVTSPTTTTALTTDDTIHHLPDICGTTPQHDQISRENLRYSKSSGKVTFAQPEEDALLQLPVPQTTPEPDGGYGWVVVLASFSIQMIGIGLAMSFGVLYIELQEYYGIEAGLVAWVGALCVGISLGAGPLSSVLANCMGHRASCMLGGLVSAVGLLVSAFAPNIYILYVTYGVVTGLGISLSYVPAVVMVSFYFHRRRPVASGLSVAGVGFGSLIYPPLIQILIDIFTWRGTMFILSGICLNVLVFASLLRPIPSKHDQKRTKICDFELFKDSNFLIFSIAEILWNVGSLIIVTIAPHHSILQGVGREQAAFLLSIIGITGTIGRVIFVFIPLHWDKLTMMTVATYVTGLPMVLYPVLGQYWVHVVHCTVYGFCFGVQLAVLPVVTVDLFGLERLTSAYGYMVLADGIGAMIGPFLGGTMYDVTGDYTLSFIVGAILSFLSGALMTAILARQMCTTTGGRRLARLSI